MRDRQPYPSDVTDKEWELLEPLLPKHPAKGRPWRWSPRDYVNALFYLLRTGCPWRQLPHDMPPWSTVYSRFQQWQKQKVWEQILEVLRGRARECSGRDPDPSALIINSQTVKTTEKGGSMATTAPSEYVAVSGISRWTLAATSSIPHSPQTLGGGANLPAPLSRKKRPCTFSPEGTRARGPGRIMLFFLRVSASPRPPESALERNRSAVG
jgi:transposase